MTESNGHPWTRLIGTWSLEAEHRLMPGEAIRGQVSFEWLEDQQFLMARWRYEHPKIPNAVAVIGVVEGEQTMHYFDVRRVHRVSEVGMTRDVWWYRNEVPGFSQRFTGMIGESADVVRGVSELRTVTWEEDTVATYLRIVG